MPTIALKDFLKDGEIVAAGARTIAAGGTVGVHAQQRCLVKLRTPSYKRTRGSLGLGQERRGAYERT